MTDNYIFVKLKHLDSMYKKDRKVYLRNLARKTGLVRLESKDDSVLLSRMLTYRVEMNDFMFAAGIIPIKIHNLWSYDGFEIRVGVRTNWNTRRVLTDDSQTSQTNQTSNNSNSTESNSNSESNLNLNSTTITGKTAIAKILNDTNSITKHLGSAWVTLFDFSGICTVLGFVLRAIVILIQFFITVVRPFTAKKGSNFYYWTISFASTLFSFQLVLLFGLLAENFGGPLNSSLEELLK